MPIKYDVIVIGAGFSGVTAARELSLLGHRVLLLEARDRIGGRTWTDCRFNQQMEMGGAYVHWYQPHVWNEITRYELEVIPSPTVDKAYWITGGSLKAGTASEFRNLLQKCSEQLIQDSRKFIPFPYQASHSRSLEELDGESVAEYVARLNLTEEERDILSALLLTDANTSLEDASVVQMFRWAGFANGNSNSFFDTVSGYKLKSGTKSLIEHIASDMDGDMLLSTEVVSVEQKNNEVFIKTNTGKIYHSSTAIVTAPLNVLRDIQFTPSLSTGKEKLISEGQASSGVKVFARIRGVLDRFVAYAPEDYPLHIVRTESTESMEGNESIVVGFGSNENSLHANDRVAVQKALQHWLPDVHVMESTSHDWVSDKFSRGTWPIMQTNQFKYLAGLKQQEGNVFFAGSIYANGWNSFIDGAIETGIATARKVDQTIKDLE